MHTHFKVVPCAVIGYVVNMESMGPMGPMTTHSLSRGREAGRMFVKSGCRTNVVSGSYVASHRPAYQPWPHARSQLII